VCVEREGATDVSMGGFVITNLITLGALSCGYVRDAIICLRLPGSSGVPRVMADRPLAPGPWPARKRCPEGPWSLAGPEWRVRHRVATPTAPLTWEGRPRILRGTAGGTHRNDTRARLPYGELVLVPTVDRYPQRIMT